MKNLFIYLFLFIILVLSSCTMEKRVYMPGYYVDWHNLKHNQNKEVLVKDENGKKTIQNNNLIVEQKEETINNITPIPPKTNNYILASVDNSIIPFTLPTFIFSKNIKPVKQQKLINNDLTLNNTVEPEECDTLILWNGEKITAKIVEIGIYYKIKYINCDNLDGSVIEINKKEVQKINYHDGTHEIISASITHTSNEKKLMFFPFALLSFLFGFGGLFFFAFLFGLAAVIIGSISLGIIVTHPKKYKGGGIAIIGILLGIFDIVMILSLFSIL